MTDAVGVAVFGASGYTGAELIRLVAAHPLFELRHAAAGRMAGACLGSVLPSLGARDAGMVLADGSAPPPDGVRLAFTALPHATAAPVVADLVRRGIRVVDLSADFRHQDLSAYREAYGIAHSEPELLRSAVYGLSEWNRQSIAGADLVANPGCYPTSVLLPLLPLLLADAVDRDGVVVDAKSGLSGAGRAVKQGSLFCEVNESVAAYGLPRHRHQWEMEEQARAFAGPAACRIRFTPHLVPMNRGMLSTLHLRGDAERWHGILAERYRDDPFVRVLPPGELPGSAAVRGSNRCDIGVAVQEKEYGVVVSCIDNLLKGAAGQAVQNANLMFGLEEGCGLSREALWP
ncbi:MAG: N-acetyl-gamma-glutamyl-phosphate reductase [Zetaproteobacteria bacterium]|nr:MAG: N-acetyl-gamma-glutamyl-phosphate reductase [Zetaproteobacteria bacterium]